MASSPLSRKARLCLIRQLNGLPLTQFDELVFALAPPSGVLSSNVGPMGNRTKELLDWVEGSTGPGMAELLALLEGYISLETILEQPIDEAAEPLPVLGTQQRSSSVQMITGTPAPALSPSAQPAVNKAAELRKDWMEAPDAFLFYGRTTELETLRRWILTDKCRLITLLGMGGMGKTALSVKISELVQEEFDYLIWRSLREAPPVEKILADLIKFLSNQQETELGDTVGDSVNQLIHYLQKSRCLLVLDNAESILQEGTRTGQYREDYEGYGTLIQRVSEAQHQSCLLITSREKPKELARLEGRNRPIRSLPLQGLEDKAGQAFLEAEGLEAANSQWRQIFEYYSGNPLALKIAANTVQDLFGGNIEAFLQQGVGVFGDIRDLLEQQFDRLSEMGQSVMYWLMINREPTSIKELKDDILEPISSSKLLETLESLLKRSLVERTDEGFTLQNVVMEYLTERFITKVSEEFITQKFELFHRHALMKATAKDYVRETQIRLILKSVGDRINTIDNNLEAARQLDGYAAGNLLNLLILYFPQTEEYEYNFSSLILRQVHLKGVKCRFINLSKSSLINVSFSETFGIVSAVAFSPDGKLVATGDSDGNIQIWDFNKRYLFTTLKGHSNWVRALEFSPNGKFLASASEDKTVRLWDLTKWICLHIFTGHTNRVWTVSFSPNSQLIASGGGDTTIRIWDIQKYQCLHIFSEHTDRIWSVAFSQSGQYLASGGKDSRIYLWDVKQGRCIHEFKGHTQTVYSVAFSTEDKFLASGSGDCTVQLWDIQKRQCVQTFHKHTGLVRTIVFSPDQNFFASGSEDHTIRIWDIQKSKCTHVLLGHANEVRSIAFSPDNQLLVSGGGDAKIKLWNVKKGQCIHTFSGNVDWVWAVAFSADGKLLVSAGGDGTIRIWDIKQQKCIHEFLGHNHWIASVAFSHDGQFLVSGSKDFTVRLWDIHSKKCINTFSGHTSDTLSVVFSPDDQLLVSSSEDGSIRIWDIQESQEICVFSEHADWVWSVAFRNTDSILASGSADSTVRLWDVKSRKCIGIFTENSGEVLSVVFSADGCLLASGGADSTICLWDVETRKCINKFIGHVDEVRTVTFSPDSQLLASGCNDGTIRIWNVNQNQCDQVLPGHSNWVRSVRFSPDGKLLASGSDDGTIRVWKVQSGECVLVLQAPRLYENTNITGIQGLTDNQRASMISLGAVDYSMRDQGTSE